MSLLFSFMQKVFGIPSLLINCIYGVLFFFQISLILKLPSSDYPILTSDRSDFISDWSDFISDRSDFILDQSAETKPD